MKEQFQPSSSWRKAFPPGSRQLVEFRAAVVLRRVPVSLQQSLAHQSKQRGVERALFDQQRSVGNLFDAQQNAVAVERSEERRVGKECRYVGLSSDRQKLSV